MKRNTQLDFTMVDSSTLTEMRNTLVLGKDKDLTTNQIIDQMDKELKYRAKETSIPMENIFKMIRNTNNENN